MTGPASRSAAAEVAAIPAIVTRGLTKRFGNVLALDGLDLEIPSGIVFGLLGPNGAGKTTAIRLLTGLARPSSGSASVAGVPVRFGDGLEARRRVGVLDQDPRFYGWMTGRELLGFVAELVGVPRADVAERVDATLERVGLGDAAGRRISGYSGGMRQRLGIGQALIGEPDLLILDEPVSSLDPEGRRDLLALIGELRESATVVFSTHVLSDVERVCDRVAILDEGRLVIEAPIDELLSRFAPPVYVIEADPGPGLAIAGLAARLEREPWVADVEVTGTTLRVTVTDDTRATRELLPAIVATGLSISAFRRERPSLEDVFLQLVGRDA
jgi:ABC-2 type transport system ATP-binding protein